MRSTNGYKPSEDREASLAKSSCAGTLTLKLWRVNKKVAEL